MRLKGTLFIGLAFVATSSTPSFGNDVHQTVVTRWIDRDGTYPITYKEYISDRIVIPLVAKELRTFTPAKDSTGILIVVNSDLYPQISTLLETYVQDLESEGYQTAVTTISGGTPTELRTYLAQQWLSDGISGALLIGDLPVPWFEMYEDSDNDSIPDNPWMVEFPIDLFYMDLDGEWWDEDEDSLFDGHSGNWEPDIWLGRLLPGPLTGGDEATLISNYFARNHNYRTGAIDLPFRALCYIDDDWAPGAVEWIGNVEETYGFVTPVTDSNQTIANDYRGRLTDQHDHILLASHSSPWLHALKENDGQDWGYFYNSEIAGIDPQVFFYNLFACSNCRYVEEDYMGGCYLFLSSYGLGVLGSTKTGSMLYFGDFYGPLGSGATIGESFRHWFALHGDEPGAVIWSRTWFYGMTLLGDPTLAPHLGLKYSGAIIDDDQDGLSSGDGDGLADAGETIQLSIKVYNFDPQPYYQVFGLLTLEDAYITLRDSIGSFGTLNPRDSTLATDFLFDVGELCPDGHRIRFHLHLSDNEGQEWLDHFGLRVNAPRFELLAADYRDQSGDWLIQPGERVGILLTLGNRGGDDSPTINGSLDCPSGQVTIINGNTSFDSLQIGEGVDAFDTLWLEVNPECPLNTTPFLRLTLASSKVELAQSYISLPVGSTRELVTDLEDNPDGLSHYAINDGFADNWHRSSQRSHSGGHSRKFGSQNGGTYSPLADGALETPLFPLWANAELSFWH